ncbi:MAG TPA: hypothetical protein VNN73_14790 [Blastocatellia bacterium]|nr:hypothetical protein [Blastocatellia bacterium]
MRLMIVTIASLALLSACAGKNGNGSVSNSAASTNQAAKASTAPQTESAAAAKTDEQPVEFTCLGIAPDKQHIAYRIKVNTEKPIEQVDIEVRYLDDQGNVSTETIIWQNIVRSVRQPIEKGKTYDDESFLYPGTTKIECALKRVVFKDFTTWTAK